MFGRALGGRLLKPAATEFMIRGARIFRGIRTHLPEWHWVLLSALFFAGLEVTFALQRAIFISLLTLFVLMTLGVFLLRREESEDFHFTQAILPILAALGLTAFALFLPASPLLHLYFLAASITLYFLLQFAARKAYPTWNWAVSAIVLFVDLATVLGWHFHLAQSLVLTLILSWLITFLLSWQALRRIPGGRTESFLLALCVGFAVAEIIWVIQFVPAHFFIQAGIALTVYYVLFTSLSRSFERTVARRDVIEYTLIGAGALSILLFSTQLI